MGLWDEIKFDANGLIPAIIQDYETGDVLMLAYMKKEGVEETLRIHRPVFWSRSRQSRWVKGETSGHTQQIKEFLYDCDADALVIKVEQKGPACHTNYRSCFYRKVLPDGNEEIVEEKLEHPPSE
jgi:phosphoribosyl-AMP cyclohydrolase